MPGMTHGADSQEHLDSGAGVPGSGGRPPAHTAELLFCLRTPPKNIFFLIRVVQGFLF